MNEALAILAAWRLTKQPVKVLRLRLYVVLGDWSSVDKFVKDNL